MGHHFMMQLRSLIGGKSFFFYMHPNQITRFKDNISMTFIGFKCILLILLSYLMSNTLMEFLHHFNLFIYIKTSR